MTVIKTLTHALPIVQPLTTRYRAHWLLAPPWQRGLLAAGDITVIAAAHGVAVLGALAINEPAAVPETPVATVGLTLAWLAALMSMGAYSLRHLRAGSVEYKRTLQATTTVAGLFGLACFLLNYSYPRTMFVLWFCTGVVGLCLVRLLRRRIMHRLHAREMFQTPVLVAGSNHHVDEIGVVLRRERWIGYRLIGAVTKERLGSTATGLPVLGQMDDLVDIISTRNVPVVIFAEGSFDHPDDFRRLAWKLEQSQVQMILAPTLADVSAERLEFRPVAGLPLVDVDRPRAIRSLRWFKRAADIAGSALLLLLLLPVIVATALAVRFEDGGPVIFRQRRVGLHGKEFDCLKFRSMGVDAEARLAALRELNEGSGVLFKMADDPRITRVGRFIRRFSIDELPQLWNALRGDMSLVGPRPALPSEVEQYDSDTRRRLQVRPGLTGLWQVSGRSRLSWEDTVRLDLYYVDNWSVVQDLMILVKTARAVLGSSGAY